MSAAPDLRPAEPDPEIRWLFLNLDAARAVKLLTRIRRERPELWEEIQEFAKCDNRKLTT